MRMSALFAPILAMTSASVLADTVARFTLPSKVNVRIIEAPFEKKLFKISGCTETSETCLINGHIPAGLPFGLPTTFVKSISISYKNQSYLLDVSDMYNAWNGRPLEHKGIIRYFGGKCFDTKNCQFRGVFSDAAGSFVAEWQIVDGVSTRTVLSDSDDIVHLFMKNIDPPEFN